MNYGLSAISVISFAILLWMLLRFLVGRDQGMGTRIFYTADSHLALGLAFFMASCGGDDGRAKATSFCAGVNDNNWRSANWQYGSYDVCVDNAHSVLLYEDGSVYTCTFGGLPYFCHERSDGSMLLIINELSRIDVPAADVSKVRPHVVRVH